MTPQVIEVGAVVQLVSGGPRLTVTKLEEHSGGRLAAYVVWFAGGRDAWGNLQTTLIDVTFLIPAMREEPAQ